MERGQKKPRGCSLLDALSTPPTKQAGEAKSVPSGPPSLPQPQDPTGLTWYSTKGELEGRNEWASETCGCRS